MPPTTIYTVYIWIKLNLTEFTVYNIPCMSRVTCTIAWLTLSDHKFPYPLYCLIKRYSYYRSYQSHFTGWYNPHQAPTNHHVSLCHPHFVWLQTNQTGHVHCSRYPKFPWLPWFTIILPTNGWPFDGYPHFHESHIITNQPLVPPHLGTTPWPSVFAACRVVAWSSYILRSIDGCSWFFMESKQELTLDGCRIR